MGKEKDLVENPIKEYLDKRKIWHAKLHGSGSQKRGLPDIIGCHRGYFFAIEVKEPEGGVVSPAQGVNIKNIRKNGGFAIVAAKLEDAITLIKYIDTLPLVPAYEHE